MTSRGDVVVIPLKSFDSAKSRLKVALSDHDVDHLVRNLAAGVIDACAPRRCVVVTDNDDVAEFATQLGVEVLAVTVSGLNASVAAAYDELGASADSVIVVHGDLIRPEGLGTATFDDGVTIVTDRHMSGTNVLAVPTRVGFNFFYGPNSARAHRDEAERCRLTTRVIEDSAWGLDLDGPEDLTYLRT